MFVHDRAQEGLDRAESTFRSQLGDNPIFGQSFPMPVFDLEDEFGFWVVTVLLGLVLAYNVWEVVALQRGSNRERPPKAPAARSRRRFHLRTAQNLDGRTVRHPKPPGNTPPASPMLIENAHRRASDRKVGARSPTPPGSRDGTA